MYQIAGAVAGKTMRLGVSDIQEAFRNFPLDRSRRARFPRHGAVDAFERAIVQRVRREHPRDNGLHAVDGRQTQQCFAEFRLVRGLVEFGDDFDLFRDDFPEPVLKQHSAPVKFMEFLGLAS
jgi:hypothetical protein